MTALTPCHHLTHVITAPRPAFRALTGLLVVALSLIQATPANASKHERERRREVQAERARKAAEIDVLKASDSELERALDRIDDNVKAQQARAQAARQAAEAAAAAATKAKADLERTARELETARASLRTVAVNAYVQGPSSNLSSILESRSLSEAATREHLLKLAAGRGTELADELRAAREDLELRRQAADAAAERAAQRRKEVGAQLAGAEAALATKARLAASVEARLERALAEAASLEAVDQKLAAEIAARQAALARRVASAPARPDRASRSAPRVSGNVSLSTVRGITVASSIADNLEGLLAAAEADGFVFSGGGYRSSDGQVAVRRSNCGTSDYAVYEMPASQCSPPTARPGQSMHEQGLAVDFTWNGGLIRSGSPAFSWLSRNAGRFGLYNLPREPWHWSTNGN